VTTRATFKLATTFTLFAQGQFLLDFPLKFSFGISRALCNQVAQSKCRLSSLPLSPRSDHKGNLMFVHPGCTNSGLRRNPGGPPQNVCVPESPTGPVTCLRLLGLCQPFAGDKAAAVLPRETAGEFFPALLGFLYLHGRTIFAECSHNFSR
jgi:hypothetical protein